MRPGSRVAIGFVLVAGLLGLNTAAPAQAATTARGGVTASAYYHCNGTTAYKKPGRSASVPVFYYGFSPVLDCVMGIGKGSANAITALQRALRDCNNAPWLAVDGRYGIDTSNVVRYIQGANGMEDHDGQYGPRTRPMIKWRFFDENGRRSCEKL